MLWNSFSFWRETEIIFQMSTSIVLNLISLNLIDHNLNSFHIALEMESTSRNIKPKQIERNGRKKRKKAQAKQAKDKPNETSHAHNKQAYQERAARHARQNKAI